MTIVSWYFEPSQPEMITSRLKAMLQTTNYPNTTKSVLTQIYIKKKKTHTHTHKHRTQIF